MATITKYRVVVGMTRTEFSAMDRAEEFCDTAGISDDLIETFTETVPDNSLDVVRAKIAEYRRFGNSIIDKYAAENVLLGITQMNKTRSVRLALADVVDCLKTGSLKDAIASARLVPEESKDAIFITDARLLGFINEIESYLGLSLSVSL